MFIHEIDLIKRIDPENPLELNQVTVYLILKNEKELEKYRIAIEEMERIMEDRRCPYKHLKILYRTKELMNRIGDKTSIAAFQEFNIMVRLFNHPTNHCYKYSFGLLSDLDVFFRVKCEFLLFLSEAACENVVSLTAALWLYKGYSQANVNNMIRHFLPLVAMRCEDGVDDEDIVMRWNDTHNYSYHRIVDENERILREVAHEMEHSYVEDVRALPHEMAFEMPNELKDEDVAIELIEGQYRQKIDFQIKVGENVYPFHLFTTAGTFIYMCILLSKVHGVTLFRNQFKRQKDVRKENFQENWMRQLYNLITQYGSFDEMYITLASGQYDYQTLNNEISKINKAIREDISDPAIQERCIIKKAVYNGDTYYYVDILPENICLTCSLQVYDIYHGGQKKEEVNFATIIPG